MPLSSADQAMQAEACRRTAMELASHDQDEHAISQFKHARELDPRIRGVAHPLAVLYDRQGRVDAAEREYLLALKETPRSPEVLNDYGYYQYSQGNFTAAESMLRLALKHDPVSEKANTNLGMTLAAQQRFDEAFQSFEKAVGPAAAHHNIGLLMLRVGREPEGLSHLEQAAHRDPSLKQTRAILASLEGAAPGTVELTQFEQLDGEPLN